MCLCPCFSLQVIHLQRAEVDREELCLMHPSSVHGVEDMSTLAELHEAAIMHNLFLRYQKDNIYVRIPAFLRKLLSCSKQKCETDIYYVCIYRFDAHLLSLVFFKNFFMITF